MSAKQKEPSTMQAVEESKSGTGQRKEGEDKELGQEEQSKAFFGKLPDPCVYCGPSVRNVARQYTVYNGGIPDALKEFIKEHRAAKGLLVSVEKFAQMRKNLETPGTGEFILFRKVRGEI